MLKCDHNNAINGGGGALFGSSILKRTEKRSHKGIIYVCYFTDLLCFLEIQAVNQIMMNDASLKHSYAVYVCMYILLVQNMRRIIVAW